MDFNIRPALVSLISADGFGCATMSRDIVLMTRLRRLRSTMMDVCFDVFLFAGIETFPELFLSQFKAGPCFAIILDFGICGFVPYCFWVEIKQC